MVSSECFEHLIYVIQLSLTVNRNTISIVSTVYRVSLFIQILIPIYSQALQPSV